MDTLGSKGGKSDKKEAPPSKEPQRRVLKRKRMETGMANPTKRKSSHPAGKKYLPVGQIPSIAMFPPFNPLVVPPNTGKLYPESTLPPPSNAYFPACAPDFDPNKFQQAMRGLQAIAKEQIRKPVVGDKRFELQIEQEIWNRACQEKIDSDFSLEGTLSSRLLQSSVKPLYKFSDIPNSVTKRYKSLIGA